jgi:arylsulfatase A-like enzyme
MKRRDFLKYISLGAATTAMPGLLQNIAQAESAITRKPNILFFFPDQHRFDWTSLNAKLPDLTPNLKQLASSGTSFSKAFCPSPLCAPSRACLATGKRYGLTGVLSNEDSLPLTETTFYKLLRDLGGYHVMGCGKFDLDKKGHSWGWNGKHERPGLPSLLEVWGFSDGIDNAGKQDGAIAAKKHIPEPYQAYLNQVKVKRNHMTDEAYTDNWIARNGLDLIRAAPKDRPWFLQINFNSPHPPFDPTESMKEKWSKTQFPLTVPEQKDDQKERLKYAAEITNIDRWLAVYRKELQKLGEWDNTIVVFSSDHGEMLDDHGYEGKERPLSASACVPLVFAGPGIKKNTVIDSVVGTIDLPATFLDFAGVPVPGSMDSKSMRACLDGSGVYPRTHVTSALGEWRLVCDGRYKLITGKLTGMVQAKDEHKNEVLYDLLNDPVETEEILTIHPEIAASLRLLLPPTS